MYRAENKKHSKLIRDHKGDIIRCVGCDENQLSKLREKARECQLPAAVSDLIREFSSGHSVPCLGDNKHNNCIQEVIRAAVREALEILGAYDHCNRNAVEALV